MDSFTNRSNSAKSIKISKKNIDNYAYKNVKDRLNSYKNKNKNSQKNNNSEKDIFSKTTLDFYSNKNIIKNIYNKMTPLGLKNSKTKYGNFFIFGKREIAFHKSIREGRKVFKYHQSTIEDNSNKKRRIRKINSLYLTETIIKRNNQTMLPLIDREKSTIDENDMSYLNGAKEKKIIQKDVIFLKNIKINKEKVKEIKNTKEYLDSKKLIKKNDIISKYNIKEKSLNNCISNLKDYLIDKYNLNIKNEKFKVINESNTNKIEKINDTIRELNSTHKLFIEDFYPAFNEHIKRFEKKKDEEIQKNLIYTNKIYLLQKKIAKLKSKILKYQNEKEFLMKEMFLQICIKEKKLNLPEYYKDILLNNLSKIEIKEKYGKSINDEEIDRVFEYKTNLDINEEGIIYEKLKRFENENIELMNHYNKTRQNIFYLKKHKKQVEDEIKNDTINDIDHMIIIKEKVLENIIKKNKKLTQDKLFLIKTRSKKRTKHSNLYYKIELLFNNLIRYKKFDFPKNKNEKIKEEITEEFQIIQIIKKIERIISYVLERNRYYKNNHGEEFINFKNLLAKKKKIEKTNEQKRNIILKFEKERKKIFEKNNKILFLQKRKLSLFNIDDKKINNKKCNSQKKIKIDRIDQYLYDLEIEN